MELMLDTCGLLSLAGLVGKRLSRGALCRIAEAETLYVSACSLFEIAIKHKKQSLNLGKFPDAKQLWDVVVAEYELTVLAITADAFFQSVALPDFHADPFDRIMIAQASSLNLPFIPFDNLFASYGLSVIS
jgi:PIN domain nuclease of toxin-antitoxin system